MSKSPWVYNDPTPSERCFCGSEHVQHADLFRSFCTSGMQTDVRRQVLLPVYIIDVASLSTLKGDWFLFSWIERTLQIGIKRTIVKLFLCCFPLLSLIDIAISLLVENYRKWVRAVFTEEAVTGVSSLWNFHRSAPRLTRSCYINIGIKGSGGWCSLLLGWMFLCFSLVRMPHRGESSLS